MIEPSVEALPVGAKSAAGIVPPAFDQAYVDGAVKPFLLSTSYLADPLLRPMIDLAFSKKNAVPAHIWGLLYEDWTPTPEKDGVTVFFQGYEDRGDDNARKRIYYSALTADLYDHAYAAKVQWMFDGMFADCNVGQPLMRQYYNRFDDMYWDLHVGVKGDAVPSEVRRYATGFNAVLGHWFPTERIVYDAYQEVRATREPLKTWVDARVQDILDGKVEGADRTIVHYWLENGQMGDDFRRKDIVFECFHNFLAFSQWGNTIYNIVKLLNVDDGDATVRAIFERTMSGDPDAEDGTAFTSLDRLVMELMRVISPNGGSLSSVAGLRGIQGADNTAMLHPHPAPSRSPLMWDDPETFNPDRYRDAPTATDNDPQAAHQAGLKRCPFDPSSFAVKDGRNATIDNSIYGAVYGVDDGRPGAICDYAGYAPFGFGYRRCAGEMLTVNALKDFLRKAWAVRAEFTRIPGDQAERIPVGPMAVVSDDIAFRPRNK